MSNWVSFHTHTQMSILDGMSKIPDLVQRAKELGMPAIGISDHGSLSGAYELWKNGTEACVKPVIGLEAYVAPASRHTKSAVYWGTPEQRQHDLSFGAYSHMTLIAKNPTGLRNLYKLHELSHTEGFYYHPRIDLELLDDLAEGVCATTGCAGGAVATLLRLGDWNGALSYLRRLVEIFGDDLYVEVMHHDTEFDTELNAQLIELAEIVGVPLLATNDGHFTRESDQPVHQSLLCVQTHSTLADPKFVFSGSGYWLRSYDEMAALPLPREALENTLRLAEQIEPYDEVFQKRNLMPKTHDGEGLRTKIRLKFEGPRDWIGDPVTYDRYHQYLERADYELDIIERMGYDDYFLVLADLVRFARNNGILVGPGRGSAGGSLVAYLLGITELDSIQHGLLFERFLNPSRVSPPDIDVDIQDDRRDEVIEYAVQKYGHDKVAQIITFGTIKSKSAIKDANRVLGGEYSEGERLVSFIPKGIRGREHPLGGLDKLREANPEVYELAQGLEGLVRSEGKHAAGVVISPEPLPDIIPVKSDRVSGMLTTVFDQETLESLGYVKLDLLSLKELSVIQRTLEMIDEAES